MKKFYQLLIVIVTMCISPLSNFAQSKQTIVTNKELQNKLKDIQHKRQNDISKLRASGFKGKGKTLHFKEQDSLEGGNIIYFKGFEKNGRPTFYTTFNNANAITVGVEHIKRGSNDTGYFGEDILIGEWDGGSITDHADFDDRAVAYDESSGFSSHATHVAGTLIGNGQISKDYGLSRIEEGMANKATLHQYYWDNDHQEMIDEAENNMLRLSNHSYGFTSGVADVGFDLPIFLGYNQDDEDYHYGLYSEVDAIRDAIVFNHPYYLPVWAAGNDGVKPGLAEGTEHYVFENDEIVISTKGRKASCEDGYDCIPFGSAGKNILTVGSVNNTDYNTAIEEFLLSPFSSRGPTDDGRIKPDIVAPGENVVSTFSIDRYTIQSGTSMATPTVVGSLALIQEASNKVRNEFLQAATLKALTINTARDTGNPGPDYHFGWGVLDAFEAVKNVENTNNTYSIIEESINSGGEYELEVTASGSEPLKVTIAWTDVPGQYSENPTLNDRTKRLVNDLDIRVYSQDEVFSPWILDVNNPSAIATQGDNDTDNVEQILIENPEAGNTYKIVINHKGELETGKQDFGLVISGLEGSEEFDFSIISLLRKTTLESLETPGVYVEIGGNKAQDNISLNYQLIDANGIEVFNGNKNIDFDPEQANEYFLAFEDQGNTPVVPKLEYKVIVSLDHSSDADERNNQSEKSYFYFVEHIDDAEDIYFQNFNGNFSRYALDAFITPDDVEFGWYGRNGAGYSTRSRTGGADSRLSISLFTPSSELYSNPFVLTNNQNYQISYWIRPEQFNASLPDQYSIQILDVISDEIIDEMQINKTENSVSGFTLFNTTFDNASTGFIKFKLINDTESIFVDDITLSFSNSEAIIPEVGNYFYNDLAGTFTTDDILTGSAYNTLFVKLYDTSFNEIELEDVNYEWNINGLEYEFINDTNQNSSNPKLHILQESGQGVAQVIINDKYASSMVNNIAVRPAYVEYLTRFNFSFLSTFSGIDNVIYDGQNQDETPIFPFYINNLVGGAGILVSYPRQASFGVSENYIYNSRWKTNTDDNVVVVNPGLRSEKRYFTEKGLYTLQVATTDSYTDGDWFNDLDDIGIFNVHNQFSNISELLIEQLDDGNFKLNWENPDFLYQETMSFDEATVDLIEIEQFEGQEILNWRLYDGTPNLSINGRYSMVSESIDEETLIHEDIDNWFYLKNANKSNFKYFSFIASMGTDFREDEYEVYLLDKELAVNPESPQVDDFLNNGIMVATEELTSLDNELPYNNYTVRKVVDLGTHELMNKELYIAFRHNTRSDKMGSFLSIDLLRFHNVIDDEKYIYGIEKTKLFDVANKSEFGWYGLNPNVYPISGYEIVKYDKNNERVIIDFVEEKQIGEYILPEDSISDFDKKIGVKLIYDLEHKVLDPKYNQEFDVANIEEREIILEEVFEELYKSNEVVVYPNPVRIGQDVFVQLKGPGMGMINYTLYDIKGAVIDMGSFEKSSIVHQEQIRLNNISTGLIVLSLEIGNEHIPVKLISIN